LLLRYVPLRRLLEVLVLAWSIAGESVDADADARD
jgi:hypothetical protein